MIIVTSLSFSMFNCTYAFNLFHLFTVRRIFIIQILKEQRLPYKLENFFQNAGNIAYIFEMDDAFNYCSVVNDFTEYI